LAQTSHSSPANEAGQPHRRPHQGRNRWLLAIAVVVSVFVLALAITAEYLARHAGPILRSSVVATLTARFHSPVELDSLDVSVARGLQVRGRGLRILYLAGPTQPGMAQKQGLPAPPMVSVDDFTFRTTLHDLLHLRANLARVDIDGMELHIPPHSGGHILHLPPPKTRITLTAAKIYCKNVTLVIDTTKPGKIPLQFDIQNLELTDVGVSQPMLYVADVINPKPLGDVHASGHFGPWRGDDPRATPLDGQYTFEHVDLSSIKGLGGTLSSTGQFEGHLGHINIDGTTSTPNFSLDVSGHPVPLETKFHAFVDGTTGDTTLAPVEATLLRSQFTAQGIITNLRDHDHDIALTVDMPHGRIEDLLKLGMKTDPPVMRGAVALHAKLHIPPGSVHVTQKMQLSGNFRIQNVEFTSARLQDQVDSLSLRAQGKPEEAKTAASDHQPRVASEMTVTFSLANATMLIPSLAYQIPGAKVNLDGVYSLDGSAFEFRGQVRTAATASQMVTGWKSVLLTPFDALFKKNGAGLQLPISISGTNGDVKFGLAMHGVEETPEQIESDIKAQRQAQTASPR
jgi:hypothetical protein